MAEADDFLPHESVGSMDKAALKQLGVDLAAEPDAARVLLILSKYGLPRRRRRPAAVRLSRGMWLRWQVNYRYVDHSTSRRPVRIPLQPDGCARIRP